MNLQGTNRDIWLHLFNEGGRYTVAEIALHHGISTEDAIERMCALRRRQLVEQFPPAPGSRRLRYGVTGQCLVPAGMRIAEVQAPIDAPAAPLTSAQLNASNGSDFGLSPAERPYLRHPSLERHAA